MKFRISCSAAVLATVAMLAACGSGGTPGPIIAQPTITLSGTVVQNGSINIAVGSGAVTLQATQPNYRGTYTFTIANSSIATIGLPVGSSARRRAAVGTVTDNQGGVTITPVASGSTTLTVQTDTTLTVPLVVSGPTLIANPTSLTFVTTGGSAAQTVTASEAAFSGTLSETDTCSGVATVTPTHSSSPYVATVTPVNGGSCTITFSDGSQTAPVTVGVTTSGVIVNSKGRP